LRYMTFHTTANWPRSRLYIALPISDRRQNRCRISDFNTVKKLDTVHLHMFLYLYYDSSLMFAF